jgi:2-polyprenyl-3-methyl-5-hydroxy-6-metoxy-1,4-benzoquinol methylase
MTEVQLPITRNLAASYKKSFDCNPEEPFQKILEELYQYIDPTTRYMHRLRINLFVDLVKELVKEGAITQTDTALDIGCNSGIYSKLISDFGFKNVRGIDIDQNQLKLANKYFAQKSEGRVITFENFNAENLSETNAYDFVLCTEVIEHTTNPDKVIANIKRLLKPGGVAIITLPNGMSYPYLLTRLSHNVRRKPIDGELRDHLKFPSYRSLELFRDQNLERIKVSGTNLYHWYFLNKVPGFSILNRMNFFLSRINPLKYFTQFFFMVYKKK